MWITVLGVCYYAIKHIVNKILKNKRGNSTVGTYLWILTWKNRVLHRRGFENVRFIFCTRFIHIESISAGIDVDSFPLPNRHYNGEKYRRKGLRED